MRLGNIHIASREAFIQGDIDRPFGDMKMLLERLGCVVTPLYVEVQKCSGVQTALPMFNVEFPAGSKAMTQPKDRSSNYTASGRKRRGAKKEVKIGWDLTRRTGKILVPGEESDFIVTYYQSSEFSPSYFDRGVIEVEKD